MLKDYFLKFISKEEALQVFTSIPEHTYIRYDLETNEPLLTELVQQTETFSIDEVGILYNNDSVYDIETNELITPATPKDGYHYNYRLVYGNKPEFLLPIELEPYKIYPETPSRTFL